MTTHTEEDKIIDQVLQDPDSQSRHFLQQLIKSNATTRHSLVICMLSTMQNAWLNNGKAGQDQLEVKLSDVYPEDLYNTYMFLWSLDQERQVL